MKKNNLILGTFLAITAILFSGCGAFSSVSSSTEKVEGSTDSTEPGGVVTIGSQVWTSKNLNVATYRNGDVIPQVQNEKAWAKLTTGAWCYYDNDASNGTKYGKLYNYYAVNDARGLAPNGYHIPTDAEWTILTDYLGGETGASKKMKSTSGWKNNGNGTNSSGFLGLPGGFRYCDGDYYTTYYNGVGDKGEWWSSSTINRIIKTELITLYMAERSITDNFFYRSLTFMDDNVSRYYFDHLNSGFSVRCIRD